MGVEKVILVKDREVGWTDKQTQSKQINKVTSK